MLSMQSITLGIDISKATFDVALYQDDTYQLGHFSNDQAGFKKLLNWLKKRNVSTYHVCMEATGRYGQALALFLHKEGYPVSIVNPARIKAYAQSQLKRNKTDAEDAKVIAHFCATQNPDLWAPSPPEAEELQMLVRRLENLKTMRTQEINRRKSGIFSKAVLSNIAEHLAFLDNQIERLATQIKELIDSDPDLSQQRDLLISIKGIGATTAAKFLAEVPDMKQFDSASQLAAYAGVTPRQKSSGTSVHGKSHLSKMGNVHLRTALYMPALSAIRSNPIIKNLVERLKEHGKPPKVIIGAVMRKLIHLAYGVLKNGKPFDPNYLQNMQISS
jgi:transposase